MIGERLLELRKDAGMTQDDLAAILNINKHFFWFLEMFQNGQFKEEAEKSIEFCKKGDVLL